MLAGQAKQVRFCTAVQLDAPANEYRSVPHFEQFARLTAPTKLEDVPAGHRVHTALPLLGLYFPATQAVHGPPSGPVKPALQAEVIQAVTDELPLGEMEPAGQVMHVVEIVAPVLVEYVPDPQSVHTALPLLGLYFPATQTLHGPPFGPVNPVLHMQAARAELASGELELVGHVMHVVEIVAPVLVEYVPDPQSVHTVLPLLGLYFPARQVAHPPPDTYVPGAHPADTHTLAPAVDVAPDSHAVHALAPVTLEYVPVGQEVQTEVLGFEQYGAHEQQYGHAPSDTQYAFAANSY